MALYGLIGFPLSQSKSPEYFAKLFATNNLKHQYELFPLENIDKLLELIDSQREIKGLNVTLPFKQEVIPLCTKLEATAQKCGSVNTLVIRRQNNSLEIIGYNTDYFGFLHSAKTFFPQNAKALVLGDGGVSQTVQYVLTELNIPYRVASRNPRSSEGITYKELSTQDVFEHRILINTTSLGMYPDTFQKPDIPYDGISKQHFLFDLIYNPEKTAFLAEGEKRAASLKNGLEMLHIQAQKAWKLWECG